MKFIEQKCKGVYLIKPKVFGDKRGYFKETYKQNVFLENGIDTCFTQDNCSRSNGKGVLRGLHYQLPPFTQAKLVQVSRGKILDVVVDIRKNSPTFGKHVSAELSDENHDMLFVPKGFAHGFVTLSETVDFLYKVSNLYSPKSERGILWNDPHLKINWKIKPKNLIDRDKNWPKLADIPKKELF